MKKQGNNFIKSLIIGIVITLVVTMSLFHALLNRYSPEYLKVKEQYPILIKERDFTQDSLVQELGKTLTIQEYKVHRLKQWEKSQSKITAYSKKKKELAKAHSFLGRSSLKFWLFVFGIVTLGFYFSIKSIIEDFKKPIKNGHQYISFIGISVCLFWYYHLFFQTQKDFYLQTYIIYQIGFSLVGSIFIYSLLKYFATKKGIIDELISLIIRIKKQHYKNILVRALFTERRSGYLVSNENIKDKSDEFDKDIQETLKKIDIL